MSKPSVNIYLRPNSTRDKAFLNIRYIYQRKRLPIPLGISIPLEDWDTKMQRVRLDVKGSPEINALIKETMTTLEYIANKLIETGKAPTTEVMKAAYQAHVEQTAIEQRRKERKIKNSALEATYEVERALVGYASKSNQLRTLQNEVKTSGEKLNTFSSSLLDRRKEFEQFFDASSGLHRHFFAHLKIAEEIVLASKATTQGSEHEASRNMFVSLLDEYLAEKTGVGLNVTKEEVKRVKRATSGTNRGLRSWAKTLVEFTQSDHVKQSGLTVSFKNLSQKFYDTYAAFLMKPEGHNLYNNTFGQHVKKLKTFLKWVELDKQLHVDRRYTRFKILTEEKEIIALTIEDINLLYDYKPEEGRTHTDANEWRKYIDLTVFSYLTSLRISDIKRLKGFRIENGCLIGKTKKTKGSFKIPLNLDPRIKDILERYNYDMLFFSDVEYNRSIKKMLKTFFDTYGLYQKPYTITRFKYTEPNPIESTHYFHELYTSHCNRRGWVSYMSDRGFDDFTLMEMMGTKSHQEFLKYKKNKVDHLTLKVNKILGR